MSSDSSVSWRLLRQQYQELLDRPPVDAAAVWRLFVEDPWYQHELRRAARWIARHARPPYCEADDLCHDAMLLLRSRLTRKPDLRLNRALAADHFGAWLRRVIRRHCLDALRRRCARQRRWERLPKDDALAEQSTGRRLAELREEIESLPPPERAVLTAYCATGTLGQTAVTLGMNYQRARRKFLAGIAMLRPRYDEPQ